MPSTSKGRVTMPDGTSAQPGTGADGCTVQIAPAIQTRASRGARLVAHLRGRGDVAMTRGS
jgi:hypothetical protein